MTTVYVVGAGVEVPLGLPVANALMAELATFVAGDGKQLARTLRDKLGRFQFSFDRLAQDQSEVFAERLLANQSSIASSILGALAKHPDPNSPAISAVRDVVERLREFGALNELPDDTIQKLADLAGENVDGADTTLLKTRGMGLAPTARTAIGRALRGAREEIPGMTPEESKALEEVATILSNIEELLADWFAGFYIGDMTRKRKYLFLAWLLWAYMRWKSAAPTAGASFYDHLTTLTPDDRLVTFNYTDLAPDAIAGQTLRFHGHCRSYIRFDRAELIVQDRAVQQADDLEALEEFIAGLDFDLPANRIFLPGIVPPIAMKPMIAPEFLDTWKATSDALSAADLIVVVGYSFNPIDRHFNDLLRRAAPGKRLAVINPDHETLCSPVCSLLGIDPASLTAVDLATFPAKRSTQVAFISATSQAVSGDLMDIVRAGW